MLLLHDQQKTQQAQEQALAVGLLVSQSSLPAAPKAKIGEQLGVQLVMHSNEKQTTSCTQNLWKFFELAVHR
jgi:hypothetical protein